jgi:hypothetical protein
VHAFRTRDQLLAMYNNNNNNREFVDTLIAVKTANFEWRLVLSKCCSLGSL